MTAILINPLLIRLPIEFTENTENMKFIISTIKMFNNFSMHNCFAKLHRNYSWPVFANSNL